MVKVTFMNWDCEVVKENYSDNGRVALSLVAADDDPSEDIVKGEPIATATSNVPQAVLADDEVLIKNYSENQGMLAALVDAGIVEDTGRQVNNGFVTFPVCRLKI